MEINMQNDRQRSSQQSVFVEGRAGSWVSTLHTLEWIQIDSEDLAHPPTTFAKVNCWRGSWAARCRQVGVSIIFAALLYQNDSFYLPLGVSMNKEIGTEQKTCKLNRSVLKHKTFMEYFIWFRMWTREIMSSQLISKLNVMYPSQPACVSYSKLSVKYLILEWIRKLITSTTPKRLGANVHSTFQMHWTQKLCTASYPLVFHPCTNSIPFPHSMRILWNLP